MLSICTLNENGRFCIVGDVFDTVVDVGLISIIDEITCVLSIQAEQTYGHDKMRHFLREEYCFKRNHFNATDNPSI